MERGREEEGTSLGLTRGLGGAVKQTRYPGRALVLSKGIAVQEAAGSDEGLW